MPESQQPMEGQNIMLAAILEGGPCQGILDVGAGNGKWGKLIRSWVPGMHANVQRLVALEICSAYAKDYRLADIYDEVLVVDLRQYTGWDNGYDVIILGDVLEHVCRADALKLIGQLRRTTARVYLTVPISKCAQNGSIYKNSHETHLDQWTHEELEVEGWEELHRGLNPNGRVTIGTYTLRRVPFK